jgi:hypothetical protein
MTMSEVSASLASEINDLHVLASTAAAKAVDYAKRAGLLLLQVKEQLPHGEFGKWLQANLTVSERTAQRYMLVAQGKQVPLRALAAKTDTVSDLKPCITLDEVKAIRSGALKPGFVPLAGNWFVSEVNGVQFWVVPDLKNPEEFHVTRLEWEESDGAEVIERYSATRWPEPANEVEIRLRFFGLAEPASAPWKVAQAEGLDRPFATDEMHGMIRVIGKDGTERWVRDAW